jgi:hypothetical protein
MINMDLTHNQMIECFLEDRSFHPDCLVGPAVRDRHVGFAYESIRSFVDSLATGAPIHATLDDGIKAGIDALTQAYRDGDPPARMAAFLDKS